LDQRIENYKQTITNMKLPKQLAKKKAIAADSTDNFDIVFWFGDLNFLITKERDKVEKKVTHLRTKRGINYEEITNHDELKQIMAEGIYSFKYFSLFKKRFVIKNLKTKIKREDSNSSTKAV
jgi:hypothetical protein